MSHLDRLQPARQDYIIVADEFSIEELADVYRMEHAVEEQQSWFMAEKEIDNLHCGDHDQELTFIAGDVWEIIENMMAPIND